MKVLLAGPSPYSAKVLMAAALAGIEVEPVQVDANNGDPRLSQASPLERIPVLVLDDGTGIYDSRLITRHLDRLSAGRLVPADDPLPAERLEAHCDGVQDSLLACVYERRFRPEEMHYQPWIDRHWGKAMRGLDRLPDGLPPSGNDAHLGSIALACLIGYLDLRFAGEWEEGREALREWGEAFDANWPQLAKLKPGA